MRFHFRFQKIFIKGRVTIEFLFDIRTNLSEVVLYLSNNSSSSRKKDLFILPITTFYIFYLYYIFLQLFKQLLEELYVMA